jgi:hypothetical protein
MQALGLVWPEVDINAPGFEESFALMREPTHYDARHLFDHWMKRTEEGGFVVGKDVPSRTLAPLLRSLVLYEPVDDGADFKARLAGSALMRRFGQDISGKRLSQLFDQSAFECQRADMLQIIRTGLPCVLEGKVRAEGHPGLHFEILALPVLAPDLETVWVLSSLFYYDWPARSMRPSADEPAPEEKPACFPSTSRIAAGQAYGRRIRSRLSVTPRLAVPMAPSSMSSSAAMAS